MLVLCFYRVIETRFLTNQRAYFLKTVLWEAISFKSGMSSALVIENVDRYGRVLRLVIENVDRYGRVHDW